MKTNYPSLLAAAACLLSSTGSRAADWYVHPSGGGSGTAPASPMLPQDAINASVSGDRIVFAAAIYNLGTAAGLNIVIMGKNLTLEGDPAMTTVLNVTGANIDILAGAQVTMSHMLMQNGAAPRCVVNGSTLVLLECIVRAFAAPEAVYVTNGFAQFERCIFDANIVGILVGAVGDIQVTDCDFMNHAFAGVDLRQTSAATRITTSTFTNNYDGVHIQPTFGQTGGLVDYNEFSGNGCGVAILSVPGGFIARDRIWSNTVKFSTSSAVYSGVGPTMTDIQGNWMESNNRGVYLHGTSDVVHNNVIVGSSGNGNGVEVAGAAAAVAHNTIAYNSNHGIIARSGDTSLYANNISFQNANHGFRAMASPGANAGSNNCRGNAVNFAGPYVNLGGNVAVVPGFVSASDFHLRAGSAMVNAANSGLFAEPIDFDGKARTAGLADIGAFER